MPERVNQQWRLAARPTGLFKESDFKLTKEPVPEPAEVIPLEEVMCNERLGGLLKSYRRVA